MNTNEIESNTNTTNITTVQSLVAEAQRRGFKIHGGFQPRTLIPMIEARIQQHNAENPGCVETSPQQIEWKEILDRLHEFLALLKTLPDRLPYEKLAAAPSHSQRSDSEFATLKSEVEKLLAENAENADASLHQPDASVPHPLGTRRSPVPHPSNHASDASPNACSDAPDSAVTSAPPGQTHESDDTPEEDDDRFATTVLRGRAGYLAQLLRESVSTKSPIDDLPPERQQALYRLVQEIPLTVIVKMIAAPEPRGWNFKTSDTSLRRFKERYRKKAAAAERAQALVEAQETIQQTGGDEQAYMDATRRLLKIKLFKNAADPEGSDEKVELFIGLLDRQRRTDLAERRVRVTEQRATKKPTT
jgi:hypothetical protein